MVHKTDKFTDERLFSSRNATTSSEKNFSLFLNRMSLGDLPNKLESMESPVSSMQPNEARKSSDITKFACYKRQQPECSTSPGPVGSTCHLVYVRRKFESEHGKMNTASNDDPICSLGFRKFNDKASEKTEVLKEQMVKPKEHNKGADEAPSHVDEAPIEILNYWTERFNRLQDYLQYLDKVGSKDYAEKFRSFSVEELNRYAVELEKRAMRLSLEEALQSKRVKDLNLMGHSSQ